MLRPAAGVGGVVGLVTLFAVLFLWRPALFFALPSPDDVHQHGRAPSSLILDRQGRLLYEIIDPHAGAHRPVPLDEMPIALRQAIIATEDATFYGNPGVNVRAILRAAWLNLRSGHIVSGGSTITQQLARNLLMESSERNEQTAPRKLREALLAYSLTRTLSKDEILALYLNETYFGNMAYGAEAAARAYFAKPAAQLSLAESSLLAGLPQSPALYDPLTNLSAARQRQRVVLDLMVRSGYITPEQADRAHSEPLQFAGSPFTIEAPHFCMLVRHELSAHLGEEAVRRGGLRIYTTLDLDLQHAAERHVRHHLATLNNPEGGRPGRNVRNAAVVVLDPGDGAVRVMVGSPDYFDRTINGAVNATLSPRQTGSAIKPLTYAAAFERGHTPATMMVDARTAFSTREGTPYVPINYDYRFRGPVLLREALASSYNVVAVRVLDQIGVDALPDMARRLGISTMSRTDAQGLAIALGSSEVPLLQLSTAYATLANGGLRVAPHIIERIEDGAGHVLYSAPASAPEMVLDSRVAYLLTHILADDRARVPGFGQSSVLETPFGAAVKTGTTTDWRDNWTVGYTTEWVVGVWVGNADNEPMRHVSGVSGAAPIWNAVIRSAHLHPPAPFAEPAGLVRTQVCATSGQLPGPACAYRHEELFIAGTQPAEPCAMHRLVAYDATTGRVATDDTPPERRVLRRVTVWPDEALAWAEEEGLPLPPPEALAAAGPPGEHATAAAEQSLRLVRPDPNSRYALADDIPLRLQQIEIVATASPSLGLRELTLWVNGEAEHTWRAPPYRLLWPLTPGEHEFRLEGIDAHSRGVTSTSIRISVNPATQERTSP
jgi:1A family penicillin-binding protein